MFGFFKKKSQIEKLVGQYKRLTKEAYTLSHSNRKLGDEKLAEADGIMKKIEELKNAEGSK